MATAQEEGVASDSYGRLCEPCYQTGGRQEATAYCRTCAQHLCVNCGKYHRLLRATKDHRVLELDTALGESRKLHRFAICEHHETEEVTMFCPTHYDLFCPVCIQIFHRECKGVDSIERTSCGVGKTRSTADILRTENGLVESFRTLQSDCVQKLCDIARQRETSLQSVSQFRNNLDMLLDKLETDIVRDIEVKYAQEKGEVESCVSCVNTGIKALDTSLAKLSLFLQGEPDEISLFSALVKARKQMSGYERLLTTLKQDMRNVEFEFMPNHQLQGLLESVNKLGSITLHKADTGDVPTAPPPAVRTSRRGSLLVRPRTAEGPLSVPSVTRQQSQPQSPDQHDIRITTDHSTCSVTASVFLPNDQLLLADGINNTLKLLDEAYSCISFLKIQSKPWDVCVTHHNDGDIYVTMPYALKVQAFHIRTGKLSAGLTFRTTGKCLGITCVHQGLAVSVGTGYGGFQIQLFTLHGDLLRSMTLDNVSPQLMKSSEYLCSDEGGTRVVSSNTIHNCVVCLDLNGSVIFTYNDQELKWPRSLSTDRRGNIYVAGYGTDNIHKISHNGSKVKVILDKEQGIEDVSSLCIRNRDGVLMTSRQLSDTIYVYKLDME